MKNKQKYYDLLAKVTIIFTVFIILAIVLYTFGRLCNWYVITY